mgnify:CR=1 FL=1
MPSSILFIIASLIWGSTFWAITQQLGQVAPAVSIAYRFGLAALSLFVWCALRGQDLRLPWRLQKWLMLQGFFTFSLSYLCTYSSEQYVVSALVAVLFGAYGIAGISMEVGKILLMFIKAINIPTGVRLTTLSSLSS